jgi:hypothetical protein
VEASRPEAARPAFAMPMSGMAPSYIHRPLALAGAAEKNKKTTERKIPGKTREAKRCEMLDMQIPPLLQVHKQSPFSKTAPGFYFCSLPCRPDRPLCYYKRRMYFGQNATAERFCA